MLTLSIDRDAQQPLYLQIKRGLIRQVENGILLPGDRLPATRELAGTIGVARISVVAAYEELKAEGYISSQVGRGTFVAERPADAPGTLSHFGTSRPPHAELRDLLALAERPGVINFSHGAPADDFLPVSLMRSAIDTVLVRDGGAAIAYEAAEGYPPLRALVARRLEGLGIHTTADEVLITGGCQQALDLAVQSLLNPGDAILSANPTYSGMLDIAHARGMIIVGVPVDADGMQTDDLETLILQTRPRLIYVAPTYHNPTGTVMPLHRRRHLIELAAQYHLPILEDGVYEDLHYEGEIPPPLKSLDPNGLTVYASSFSKTLLPGMRIGYLVASGGLGQRLARVKRAADICTPALNQRAIHLTLENGQLDEHIARARAACRQRRDVMLDALKTELPEAQARRPSGGLYIWAEIPENGPTAIELYLHAVRNGAAFAMGPLFYRGEGGACAMRLNIAAYAPPQIEEGIRRIAAAWRELAEGRIPAQSMLTPFV